MKYFIFFLPIAFISACATTSVPARTPASKKTVYIMNTNNIANVFVKIPAGTFIMGSPEAEHYRSMSETQHSVTISHDFEMQATPVTQAQFLTIELENPSYNRHKLICPNDYDPEHALCPNNPVENVDWYQVQLFIKAINARNDGYIYRLPTEAEWEYAARAGTTSTFSYGNDVDDLGHYAWYYENAFEQTHVVGTKKPNPWGLYDMHGNVRQWVQDFEADYPAGPVIDPVGPPSGDRHIIRGGSYANFSMDCRSAVRYSGDVLMCNPAVGFRLVRVKR